MADPIIEDPMAMFRDPMITEPELEVIPPEPEGGEKDKDKKKNKDVQVGELKKAKEKAEADLKEAQKKLQELEEYKPLGKIAQHIKTKFEKIDDESVDAFINRQKERKTKLNEAEKAIQEKDLRLKDVDIQFSDEWKNEYVAPLMKSKEALVAEIAPIGDDGKIRHFELVDSLYQQLAKIDDKGKPLNAIQIKQILTKFEKEYEQKTGEEYDVPNLANLQKTIEAFASKQVAAIDAKRNWAKTKEEINKTRLYEQSEAQKNHVKKETEGRNFITKKLINEFDFSSVVVDDVITQDLFEEELEESNKKAIGYLTGDKKVQPLTYEALLLQQSKAKFYDALRESHTKLQEEVKTLRAKLKSGVPHGGSKGGDKPPAKSEKPITEVEDPMAMFRS